MAKRDKDRYIASVMGHMRLKNFKETVNNLTPCIYAAMAMALYEKGWRYKRINDLFMRSQEIWQQKCFEEGDMAQQCYEMTGIDVRSGGVIDD